MAFFSGSQRFSLKEALSFFKKKETSYLGIDIGASSIKVVQVRKEEERGILETYGELSLARYTGGEEGRAFMVMDTKLTEALGDVLRESQVTAKRANISIPLKDSFITTMQMPNLSEGELKEAVPYEARKYIPVPIAEVTMDWWVLPAQSAETSSSSIGSGERKFVSVLLVAVPKDVVSKYETIIKNAGVEVVAFEIEAFAFVRAAVRRDIGSVLLLDLGASASKMMIVEGGVLRMAHSIGRGSQEFTLTLAQSLGIDFERAEILKRESGIARKPETEGVVSVLEPLVDFIASEGERFLLDWKRRGGSPIAKVVLGGGGALLRGVDELIVKKFGVEVEIANPFSRVVYPAFLEPPLKNVGASFTNAIGLVLREF